MLLVINPLLALCALVPLPIVNVLAKRFSAHIHPAVLAVQAESAELATVVEETVAGVRVVKGFGAEPVQAGQASRREAEDVRTASLRAAGDPAALPARDRPHAVASGSSWCWASAATWCVEGSLTIGGLVAFNAYVALLVWPLRTIGMTVSWGQRAAAALERVHEVLSTEPIVTDPPHPKALPARSAAAAHRRRPLRRRPLRLRPAHPVLDGFDLDHRAGLLDRPRRRDRVAASRPSPACSPASTTWTPAPSSSTGSTSGGSALHDLRRAVGIVFEDTLLFHDTVAANIAFADPDASFERIERAAALAGATEFVDDLPHGYDTLLGERGFSLSGGQRQRIAIARAILADPRVLVLDDATSAVDPSKEHEIRDALATVMAERTHDRHRPPSGHDRPGRAGRAARRRAGGGRRHPRGAARGERPLRRGPGGVGGPRRRASRPPSMPAAMSPALRLVATPSAPMRRSSGGGLTMWATGAVAPEDQLDRAATTVLRRTVTLARPVRRDLVVSILLIAGSTLVHAGRPDPGPLRHRPRPDAADVHVQAVNVAVGPTWS